MDRNSLVGLFLIGIIIILYSLYNQPTQEELAQNKRREDSLNAISQQEQLIQTTLEKQDTTTSYASAESQDSTVGASISKELTERYGSFGISATGTEKVTYIENELIKVGISNKGGVIKSLELKQYKTHNDQPLMLMDQNSNEFNYQFFANNRSINTKDLFFKQEGNSFQISGKDQNSIAFRLHTKDGGYLEQRYTLKGNSYEVGYNVDFVNLENILSSNNNYATFNWNSKIINQEKSLQNERNTTTIYYKYKNEDPDYLSDRSEAEEDDLTTSIKWISFKQQFFNATLIAEEYFDEGDIKFSTPTEGSYVKDLNASIIMPLSNTAGGTSVAMKFYFGPNDYATLKSFDIGLDKLVPLGWGIFRWVNKFIIIPVFDFLNGFIDNYGIIILILTFLIKGALFPFTYKSYTSTAKMRVIQPEINALKEKYGNDAQKMNAEQMKLFSSAGVNPLGGCLPMLLQMPILIAMYSFFPSSIELRQESFLWAQDLSTYDSILDLPFEIPFYGDHVSLFTLLMTITSFATMQMNGQAAAGNPQMKMMQYIMPVIFLPMFNSFSAGLTYYYFLSNVITFLQQVIIRKYMVDDDKIRAQIQERKKKPKKKSNFQKRLEDMAKARQQQARRK